MGYWNTLVAALCVLALVSVSACGEEAPLGIPDIQLASTVPTPTPEPSPASAAKVTTPFASWESVVESASPHSTVIPKVEVIEPETKQTAHEVEVNEDAVVEVKEPPRIPKGVKRSPSNIRAVNPTKGRRSKTQTALRNTVSYHPFLTRRELRR